MQELTDRISQALAKEEERAERFANSVRLVLLGVLTVVAVLNAPSLTIEANALNLGALLIGYAYGFAVLIRIRRRGYRPVMKYVTSCLDVVLVFLLLFLYTKIEIPSVALKNYVFFLLFPLIGLTAFRYDRKLTLTAGGLALGLYVALFLSLLLSHAITIANGGYAEELFSRDVTYIGQLTKIFILIVYVTLLSYLARYSRRLFAKLIGDELNLRSQKELMDWEIGIASRVQTRFLPHSLPAIEGLEIYGEVQQGRSIGGDYYDFLPVAGDTLLVVTADVSGKGIPAALIMAEVRASMQLLAPMHLSLEDLVQRLNTLLHQSTDKKDFVTFSVAAISPAERRMTYVNAGHLPPLIRSSGGVRSLKRGTLPLGLFAPLPKLIIHTEEFLPGDVFVSYTDGIVEQTNPLGEQYGEERLLGYVSANAHLDVRTFTTQLFVEVKTFAEGRGMDDDATIAVVKFSPP